jgi:hypothetical protein
MERSWWLPRPATSVVRAPLPLERGEKNDGLGAEERRRRLGEKSRKLIGEWLPI